MTEMHASSFEEHLGRGDLSAAAEWLVRAHGRDVLHLCAALVRDRSTAEDLAQDAFSKAFLALPEFRGEASARTWLLTIARHRCLDHLRRSARQPWTLGREEDLREPLAFDDEELLVSELLARRADLREGLAALSETERAMVTLRFGHGLSFDEIADTFGVKAGAVRMRVGRALAKMRDAIEHPLPPLRVGAGTSSPIAPRAAAPAPSMAMPPPAQAPSAPAPSAPAALPGPPRGVTVLPLVARLKDLFRPGQPSTVAPPAAPAPPPPRSSAPTGAPPAPPPAFAAPPVASGSALPVATLGALLLALDPAPGPSDAFVERLVAAARRPVGSGEGDPA